MLQIKMEEMIIKICGIGKIFEFVYVLSRINPESPNAFAWFLMLSAIYGLLIIFLLSKEIWRDYKEEIAK